MKEYRVFIVPKEIIAYGKNKEEAIKNAIEHLKEYKDRLFVAKEEFENDIRKSESKEDGESK